MNDLTAPDDVEVVGDEDLVLAKGVERALAPGEYANQVVRGVLAPFLGRPMSIANLRAMKAAVEPVLRKLYLVPDRVKVHLDLQSGNLKVTFEE